MNTATRFRFFVLGAALSAAAAQSSVTIGERPAVEEHLDQAAIESGAIPLDEVLRHGRRLFEARFNALDGQGRPGTTGSGAPRPPGQPAFVRTSGPDANSCFGCHFEPRIGGGAEFSANVFVTAQERDPVLFSIAESDSNERNSLGMFGSGAIELLAREMSAELIATREAAKAAAVLSGTAVTRPLAAKGVSFGHITVLPDGRVDPSAIEGVDWDLVVRPFHQKGAVASLREFTNTALNHHFGIQADERFGANIDADGDGKTGELTVGDITALTLFQAALGTPGRLLPSHPERRLAAQDGERLFAQIGCVSCHRPALVLDNPVFSEPGPFNPPGNLRPKEVGKPVAIDLTREGAGPHLERLADGRVLVRAFTDLKRHDLNDADHRHFANERVSQGTLAARVPSAAFTELPKARPLAQFLTRKLWDAGNSDPYGHRGDLSTLSEAIHFHGGEARAARDAYLALPADRQAAIIEFLKTLQILPEGPPPKEAETPAGPPASSMGIHAD